MLAKVPDAGRRLALGARALGRRTEPGDPVGRLRIPAIGLRTVVVEGTDPDELRAGPGHYPGSVLPGQRGTVALAGHRTTYGAPFRDVDALDRGDRMELATPYGTFTYRVDGTRDRARHRRRRGRRPRPRPARADRLPPAVLRGERIVVSARLERAVPTYWSH